MFLTTAANLSEETYDVCVVGSGPVGLITCLELSRYGLKILLVESGIDRFNSIHQALSDAQITDPKNHAALRIAVRRAFGGNLSQWGGRCVAFDDLDFERRSHVPNSGWPFRHADIRMWYEPALGWLDAGRPIFEITSAELSSEGPSEVRINAIERWCAQPDLRKHLRRQVAAANNIHACLGATVTDLEVNTTDGLVRSLKVLTSPEHAHLLHARAVVLACGGLENCRLLLVAQSKYDRLFGGSEGPLGRYYMGHLSGKIADVAFEHSWLDNAFDFFVDKARRYVRRRFTVDADAQHREKLLNFAAWPNNPPLQTPEHGNAILSMAYLALASPLGRFLVSEGTRRSQVGEAPAHITAHIQNLVRDFPRAMIFAARFLPHRYLKSVQLPGFFLKSQQYRYAFHYHAEQAPSVESCARLSGDRDSLGVPRLNVRLKYGRSDAQSVVRSHEIIDAWLRRHGYGYLNFNAPEADRVDAVMNAASDGYHQIGTTRISLDPKFGVVDADAKVHGTKNLFVAGSSIFPTSGQASPTLLAVALSVRLAAHLSRLITSLPGI